ncbi:MAG: DUF922 domain-containing protein [Bacteroidota bacterium]
MMPRRHLPFLIALLILLVSGPLFGFLPADGGEGEIRWRKNRRLTWDDFRGRPDRRSPMDALTESGISFSWSCDYRGFQHETYSMFVPDKSWVKEESDALLRHEQLHFDITELHARKIRKYFGELRYPCRLGQRGINSAAQRLIRESSAMQQRYDRETNHSLREEEQVRWERYVARELTDLEPWAR